MSNSLQIDVSGNIQELKRYLNATKQQVEVAARHALNKTAMWVRTRAVREISAQKNIPQKIVRERLQLSKATRKQLEASLWIGSGRTRVRASRIGKIRQTKVGAVVRGHVFEGAFVAVMPSGDEGIYKRKTKARLPIKELKISLYRPSLEAIDRIIEQRVMERFEVLFERELNYVMSK